MAAFLFLFGIQSASAEPQCTIVAKKGVTIDLNRMSECMEERFGFDENSLRRGNKKKMAPTVDVSFNKTNPQEGEKVTALAAPKGFKNSMENLYYTWYIIHTDADGNYTNTVTQGKREAMGIIARGNFDPDLFGINYGAIPAADLDEDGFDAPIGGADGVGAKLGDKVGEWDDEIDSIFGDENEPAPAENLMFDEKKQIVKTDSITRCYRHNFGIQTDEDNLGDSGDDERAGRDRIINCRHETPSCNGHDVGDGSFDADEEECWETDPTNADTDGDGVEDEADLMGLNQTQFTWIYQPGDRVGVSVEGTSMIPISEGGEQTTFNITGYRITDPVTGATVNFGSRAAASDYCENFLPDSVDMGSASASATGGSGSGDSTGSSSSGGSSSVNVDLDADMTAYNLGMARYDACDDSLEEIYESGIVTGSDGKLNAYYKIMWATPGICAQHNDSRNLVGDDDCEPGQSDVGFNYLAAVPVDETGGVILDPELSVIPESPQFDAVEPNVDDKRSDLVKINTSMSNSGMNEDHLYYRWVVERCVGNDFTNCNVNVENRLKFESFKEGMGIRELKFIPVDENIFGGESKIWLKATVVVSEHESLVGDSDTDAAGHTIGAIESIFFPMTRNIVDINLTSAEVSGAGLWQPDASIGGAGLICDANLYKDICPIYPYQVLVLDAAVAGGIQATDRFSWQINDKKIEAPETCTDISGIGACDDSQNDRIYVPIQAVEDEVLSVQLTLKRANASGLISEYISQRIVSVASPKPVIEVVGGATATTRADGSDSDSMYEADNGTVVTFRAAPVPRYLSINNDAVQEDHEVDLIWYINDTEVDAQFIADNKFLLNTAVAGDQITFTIPNDMTLATGIDLKARLVKKFGSGPGPIQHDELLKSTWRVNDTHTLSSDTSISVRASFNLALAQDITLKQYVASSIGNAPHYLVFAIRLSIALVLVWSLLFGFSYAVKLNKEL